MYFARADFSSHIRDVLVFDCFVCVHELLSVEQFQKACWLYLRCSVPLQDYFNFWAILAQILWILSELGDVVPSDNVGVQHFSSIYRSWTLCDVVYLAPHALGSCNKHSTISISNVTGSIKGCCCVHFGKVQSHECWSYFVHSEQQ